MIQGRRDGFFQFEFSRKGFENKPESVDYVDNSNARIFSMDLW